ncbi:hypothetical protein [Azospirillum sp. sgz302134]
MAEENARAAIRLRPQGLRFGVPHAVGQPINTPVVDQTAGVGMAQVAKTATGLIDTIDARVAADERLTAAKWRAEDRTQWAERFQQAKEQAPPGAPDFTKGMLEQYDQWAATRLDGVSSRTMRQEVELGLVNLRGQIAEQAMAHEAGARVAKRRTDIEDVRRLNGHAVAGDLTKFDSLLSETENAIRASGLPAEIQADEIKRTRTEFATAGLTGLTLRDPAAAIGVLQSGAFAPFVDPDRAMRLQEHATVELRRREAEARRQQEEARATLRVQVEGAVRDELTAYQRGDSFAKPVTDEKILAAYGPERGSSLIDERRQWRQFGADVATVAMLPPQQQAELLKRYRPEGEGYANEADRYDRLTRAITADAKRRADDPAQYVLDHSPVLRDLTGRSVSDPQAGAQAVALSLDLQARAGIPEADRRVLPKPMAENVVTRILSAPAEQRADVMEQLATGFGSHWPKVYGELVEQKLPPDMEVLATVPHPVARRELAEAQAMGKDPLRKTVGDDAKAVDQGVRDVLDPLRRSLALVPDGAAKAAQWEEQTRLLAYRKAQYLPPDEAVKRAAEEMVIGKYDWVPQGDLMARTPKGEGQRATEYAITLLSKLTPQDLADPGGMPTLTAEQRRGQMLAVARNGSAWVTNGTDDGWVLVDRRREPVLRADGRRVEFRFADIPTAASPGASSASPTQDVEAIARRAGLTPEQVRANAARRRAAEEE